MRTTVLLLLMLVLAWYVSLVGRACDRNTASLGALWARVDTLETQVEAREAE